MTINERIIIDSDIGGNASNATGFVSLPRFRWYGYKEGFSSILVEKAISEVGLEGNDYILDPFNGSGTVTLTAALNNIKAVGIEVNPFAAFMAEVKMDNAPTEAFSNKIDSVLTKACQGVYSPLNNFSTFSEKTGKDKWLFNSDVLNAFESSWQYVATFSEPIRKLIQLSLIGAAMDNCNASKDGKCLKYRKDWISRGFNSVTYVKSLEKRLINCKEDLISTSIKNKAKIINADSREEIKKLPKQYKLCVTSPPYLNSFDYTDIYRPELFLGKFISSNQELKELRFKTIRSHVEIVLPKPKHDSFGKIYNNIFSQICKSNDVWSKQIPIMIQSYFEDMESVLVDLYEKAKKDGELWMVVANSVYVDVEIPVDLILAEIGTRNKWKLKRIEVLRYINRRKTKYNGDIDKVRESLIVFQK
ncbi:MAG: hypothetical protein IKQ09_01370 [Bacteroidales bacterium]|nr:hypothetical protein [Bacteroidales bacterium]